MADEAAEWSKFKVGNLPSAAGFVSRDLKKFDAVSHTSHVAQAIGIVEAGAVNSGLVFDKSKLNTERILVSWVSPNEWRQGYRYGNVCFEFDFAALIEGKKFYWVEAIAYNTAACRILVTDQDRRAELVTYDPEAKDGPWWRDPSTGQNYFNSEYCLEFMIEGSVGLGKLKRWLFVDHHDLICSIHRKFPRNCPECGLIANQGGALFLARVAAVGARLGKLVPMLFNEAEKLNPCFSGALGWLQLKLISNVDFKGELLAEANEAMPVMRAALSAYAFGRRDDAKIFSSMFKSEEEMKTAFAKTMAKALDVDDWKRLAE